MTPELGVCYYPEHWPEEVWEKDARDMRAMGLTWVRIAEFAWSRIEPQPGQFNWEWLDRAVGVLGAQGLHVVLGTPTATPPRWMLDKYPDMIALDKDGHPRKFGSRRHYCFSHEGYRKECARITEILAKRYGDNPHVVAWQVDNEYGCHETTISYSNSVRDGFRDWLAQKYQSPDALNRAWGNVFWSMEVSDFSQIELPNLTVTEPNPAHVLDFRRYASDQVVAFNRIQTNILRKHSPGRDLIHNFMGRVTDFDHFDVSVDLDVASWDSYPIGNLERFGRDNEWKNWYMRAGDPDFQAFHHDLYRGCGQMRGADAQNPGGNEHHRGEDVREKALHEVKIGRFWVMEQQPGPVNWAPYNPAPYPGAIELWAWEAFPAGADVVSYFRWRQAPYAQEQMHAALNRPDGSPDRAYGEAQQVSRELAELPDATTEKARVALIFDYASLWATDIQPQGADYDGFALVMEFYSALRQLGQSIDVLPSNADLAGYKLIVVPQLLMVDEGFAERLQQSGAHAVFGPRCGSRTSDHNIPDNLPPGSLQNLIPMKIDRVESLRPGIGAPVETYGRFVKWAEQVSTDDNLIILRTQDGHPALIRNQTYSYMAGWADPPLMHHILRDALNSADLTVEETGDDVRIRDRGKLRTIVNYAPKPKEVGHLIAKSDEILIGSSTLDVAGVTIVRKS